MSSTDHCIITKYDLSEREKEIKKAFFSKKESQIIQNQTKKNKSVYNSNMPEFKGNEEMINKLIDENFNNKIIKVPVNTQSQSAIPLNLIYSQNKILERNVDVLHETQRSIHDLLVYNLQKDKKKTKSDGDNLDKIKQMQMIQQMITPIYQSVEEMKRTLAGGNLTTNPNSNKSSNLNDKVGDMMNIHSNFRESSNKFTKDVEQVEKNKQMMKDNQILRAIEDLKNSVGQINTEMNKMENEFGSNLKKIVEDREKDNLKSLMGGINSNNNTNAMSALNRGGMSNNNFQQNRNKKNDMEELDYVEYKNEILDINQRKEEILNEFQFNKLVIPKVARPSEKISFSYKLDFEEEGFNKMNFSENNSKYGSRVRDMNNSSSYGTDQEMFMNKKDKNVFLNNLNNSGQTSSNANTNYMQNKHNRHVRSLSNNNSALANNMNNQSTTMNTKAHLRTKSREVIYNERDNHIQVDDTNLHEEGMPNEEEMSIAEKMRRFQEKMSSLPKKNQEDPNIMSINVNSTKNSVNKSTEPSSSKYLRSPVVSQKDGKQKLLAPVEEKEDAHDDYVIRQLKIAERELQNQQSDKIRKGITLVEVTPQDRSKHSTLEDLILKLCVEKMIKKKPVPGDYVNIPSGVKDNIFPFSFHEMQVKFITEGLFRDYIRSLLRGRTKKSTFNVQPVTEIIHTYDNEMLNIFREENERRDKEMSNLLNGLFGRFADMEKTLQDRKEPQLVPVQESNIDIDDMVNKITDKIRSNMHININLTQPQVQQNIPQRLEVVNQQLEIEGLAKEEEKSQSYINPFQDTRRVNYDELNKDIPMPYFINLEDYNVSSSSYVSDTKRTLPVPKKKREIDESLSEGQIPNSKLYTDQDTSSYMTTPGGHGQNKNETRVGSNNNGIDIRGLEKFNQQIQSHLKNFQSLDFNEYLDHSEVIDQTVSNRSRSENNQYESLYNADEGEESSTISINVQKHMVNLENNNDLKTLNLYDSDEHRLFQRQFGESGTESRQNSEFDPNSQRNKSDFKFYKPGNTTGKISQNSNPTLFSFQNVMSNRSEKSASATMSNRPLFSSGGLGLKNNDNVQIQPMINSQGSINPKFTKISNDDIENLITRQNNLNDRLKLISRNNASNIPGGDKNLYNNTIPENYSDMEVTIHQDLNTHNHNQERRKIYKTDESSSMNTSTI